MGWKTRQGLDFAQGARWPRRASSPEQVVLKSSQAAFINALKLLYHVANIADLDQALVVAGV